MTRLRIALLGVAGTGKKALAQALAAHWQTQGLTAEQTPEVVDTTPLFTSNSTDPGAIAQQRSYSCTLLMGLDPRADPAQEAADAALRAAMRQGRIAFSVLHGGGAEQLSNALFAINLLADDAHPATAMGRSGSQTQWRRPCEKCSDPACEHRLFSDLLAARP